MGEFYDTEIIPQASENSHIRENVTLKAMLFLPVIHC